MKPKKYVAYYRVSTKEQDAEMPAQKRAVKNHLKDKWPPIKSFRDIASGAGSGKKIKHRPELLKALEYCKKEKAVLVVAKLDRLSRDLHFITSLSKSKIDFVCCDFPNMNKLQLHILGTFAEWERDQISDRVRRALAEKKEQGMKLGYHNPKVKRGLIGYWKQYKKDHPQKPVKKKAAHKAETIKIFKVKQADRTVLPAIKILRKRGLSFEKIAGELNTNGMASRQNCKWHKTSVLRVAKRNGLK